MVKGCHTYLDKQWFLVIEMEKRERARARVVYIISDYKRFPCHINNMNVLFKQKMCFWVELNSDPPLSPTGPPLVSLELPTKQWYTQFKRSSQSLDNDWWTTRRTVVAALSAAVRTVVAALSAAVAARSAAVAAVARP